MALTYFADAPMDRSQILLFYPTLDDRIPADHPVRILDELADAFDYSEFEREYHGSRGQPPIPPQVIVKAWLYGYARGIRSSRRLEYAIGHNIDFLWLVQGWTIDHVTLAKFRAKFKTQIKTLFRQVGRFAAHAGLLQLLEVTFDGTRVKANNGRSETLTAEGIEARLAELSQEFERRLQESDREDERDDERLGTDATGPPLTPELADLHERRKRLEQAKAAVEKLDRERQRGGKNPDRNPAQIPITDSDSRVMPNSVYDAEQDVYHCPQGQPLRCEETKQEPQAGGQALDVWIYRCRTCSGCPLAPDCMDRGYVHRHARIGFEGPRDAARGPHRSRPRRSESSDRGILSRCTASLAAGGCVVQRPIWSVDRERARATVRVDRALPSRRPDSE